MTLSRRERKKKARGRGKYSLWIPLGLCLVTLVGALALYSSGYAGVLISRTEGRLEAEFPGNDPGAVDPVIQSGDDEPGHNSDDPMNDPCDGPSAPLDDGELSRLGVNELGKIPIIMYHDVQDYEAEWVRSRTNLRNDLLRFYNLGYSLVLLSDYLSGNISVPAGRAPLVLTFDDGTRGQFRMVDSDRGLIPDPDCAVGILLEFSRTHPEFGHAATFFVNSGDPFGDASQIGENLTFLLENGMEIGNHTRTHANLAYASPETVAREIGSLVKEIRDACGCEPASLALPFGGYPRSTENLLAGTWGDQEYANKGILLVGAEPAPSPFSKKFNPLAIPRIRGSQEELDKWLGEFEKYPDERFVSDGRSEMVTIRQGRSVDLDPERVRDLKVREYPTEMTSVDGRAGSN